MTDNGAVEGGVQNSPTLDQQFAIIRESFDQLSDDSDSPYFKSSQGRYRYKTNWMDVTIAFSYVFGEASITVFKFGTQTVVDSYVGQQPLAWFLKGVMTPDSLYLELHTRLHNLSV